MTVYDENSTTQNRRLLFPIVTVACVLAMPLLGIWFGLGVNWSAADFIIAGALVLGGAILYGVVTTKLSTSQRYFVTAVIVVIAVALWAELAVGVIGTPIAGS